jgi:anti-repressor protein
MSKIQKIFHEFEGRNLTTITYKGRPCWIARQVGNILGYAEDGGKLVKMIQHEWLQSFQNGKHYIVLAGEELSDFKSLFDVGTCGVPSRAPRIMLLFEPGIHKVALKSGKPQAERLQDFLADDVMPQLARDGRYSPEREVVDGEIVDNGIQIPKTYVGALKACAEAYTKAAELADQNERLEAERARMLPAALYGKKLASAKGFRLIGNFVKGVVIDGMMIGQNNAFKYLRKKGILIDGGRRHNCPQQEYLDAGWFVIHNGTRHHRDGSLAETSTTLVTAKGECAIVNLMVGDPDFYALAHRIRRDVQECETMEDFQELEDLSEVDDDFSDDDEEPQQRAFRFTGVTPDA